MKLTDEEKKMVLKQARLLGRAEFRDYMNGVKRSLDTHERTSDMQIENDREAQAAALAIFSARLMKHPFKDPANALKALLGEVK